MKVRFESELEESIQDLFRKKGQLLKIFNLYYNVRFGPHTFSGTTSPTHDAIIWGMVRILRVLIDLGANFDSRDDKGQTPLILAMLNGQETAARLLLDSGAET